MNIEAHHKTGKHHSASLRLLCGMLTTLALGGCGLTHTRIDATDNRVFLPTLKAAINLGDSKQAASEPQTGHAIIFGVTKTKGSDSQSLVAGQQPITLNSTTFTPPEQLQNNFDYSFADISWRWRKFFKERSLGLEVTAGIAFSSLGLTVSSPTQSASERYFNRGPQAGVGLIWRLNPSTSLQGRGSAFATSDDHGVGHLTRYELCIAKAFLDNLTLRGGYTGWNINGRNQLNVSDFRVRFSGPILALDWDFNTGY